METAAHRRYVFVDWLKVISMLMIVWDHLVAVRYPDMWLVQNVKEWINTPLGIIQEFGATVNRNIAVVSALIIMFIICCIYHWAIEEKYNSLFKKLLKY